jgi:hypothetical protein
MKTASSSHSLNRSKAESIEYYYIFCLKHPGMQTEYEPCCFWLYTACIALPFFCSYPIKGAIFGNKCDKV